MVKRTEEDMREFEAYGQTFEEYMFVATDHMAMALSGSNKSLFWEFREEENPGHKYINEFRSHFEKGEDPRVAGWDVAEIARKNWCKKNGLEYKSMKHREFDIWKASMDAMAIHKSELGPEILRLVDLKLNEYGFETTRLDEAGEISHHILDLRRLKKSFKPRKTVENDLDGMRDVEGSRQKLSETIDKFLIAEEIYNAPPFPDTALTERKKQLRKDLKLQNRADRYFDLKDEIFKDKIRLDVSEKALSRFRGRNLEDQPRTKHPDEILYEALPPEYVGSDVKNIKEIEKDFGDVYMRYWNTISDAREREKRMRVTHSLVRPDPKRPRSRPPWKKARRQTIPDVKNDIENIRTTLGYQVDKLIHFEREATKDGSLTTEGHQWGKNKRNWSNGEYVHYYTLELNNTRVQLNMSEAELISIEKRGWHGRDKPGEREAERVIPIVLGDNFVAILEKHGMEIDALAIADDVEKRQSKLKKTRFKSKEKANDRVKKARQTFEKDLGEFDSAVEVHVFRNEVEPQNMMEKAVRIIKNHDQHEIIDNNYEALVEGRARLNRLELDRESFLEKERSDRAASNRQTDREKEIQKVMARQAEKKKAQSRDRER